MADDTPAVAPQTSSPAAQATGAIIGQGTPEERLTALENLFLFHRHRGPQIDQTNPLSTDAVELMDGATIQANAALGSHFYVTLGGNRTLAAPLNLRDGQRIIFEIIQDATGSRTLAFDGKFKFGNTLDSIILSTGAHKHDFIGVIYKVLEDALYVVGFLDGY